MEAVWGEVLAIPMLGGGVPALAHPYPAERDPLHVYLAGLAPRSRRVMASALERQARLLTSGRRGAHDVDWTAVRYQHSAALRAALQEPWRDEEGDEHRLSAATVNLYLAALRGLLKNCAGGWATSTQTTTIGPSTWRPSAG